MQFFLLTLALILAGSGFSQAQVHLTKTGKVNPAIVRSKNLKVEIQRRCPLKIVSPEGADFQLSADGKSNGPASSKGQWFVDGSQLVIQNKNEGKEFRFSLDIKNKNLHIDDFSVKQNRENWVVEILN